MRVIASGASAIKPNSLASPSILSWVALLAAMRKRVDDWSSAARSFHAGAKIVRHLDGGLLCARRAQRLDPRPMVPTSAVPGVLLQQSNANDQETRTQRATP